MTLTHDSKTAASCKLWASHAEKLLCIVWPTYRHRLHDLYRHFAFSADWSRHKLLLRQLSRCRVFNPRSCHHCTIISSCNQSATQIKHTVKSSSSLSQLQHTTTYMLAVKLSILGARENVALSFSRDIQCHKSFVIAAGALSQTQLEKLGAIPGD